MSKFSAKSKQPDFLRNKLKTGKEFSFAADGEFMASELRISTIAGFALRRGFQNQCEKPKVLSRGKYRHRKLN